VEIANRRLLRYTIARQERGANARKEPMTPDRAIETAADYADSLMSTRSAKNIVVLILVLMLLGQLALFFLVRFDVVSLNPPVTTATTQPAVNWLLLLHYGVGITAFLGVTMSIVLSLVLLLVVNIMLVGRLLGAGRVTSAFIWSLVLLVLLFPWQSFLNHVGLTPDQATFKIPGVLYTYFEIADPQVGAKFQSTPTTVAILKWSRFVVFPVIAIFILLVIQAKSTRGLRQSLGEADIPSSAA
jgi:hypothetical protein